MTRENGRKGEIAEPKRCNADGDFIREGPSIEVTRIGEGEAYVHQIEVPKPKKRR